LYPDEFNNVWFKRGCQNMASQWLELDLTVGILPLCCLFTRLFCC